MRELNRVFDEFDLCNELIANLSAISAKLLEIDADAVLQMIEAAKQGESQRPVMQMVRASMQTLHHGLEFIRCIELTLDYLFIDSYRYEQIFKLFVEMNPQLIDLIVKIVAAH